MLRQKITFFRNFLSKSIILRNLPVICSHLWHRRYNPIAAPLRGPDRSFTIAWIPPQAHRDSISRVRRDSIARFRRDSIARLAQDSIAKAVPDSVRRRLSDQDSTAR